MGREHTVDKLHRLMFSPDKEEMTEHEAQLIKRYEYAFTMWLDKPFMSDKEIRDVLISNFGISQSQAYVDISKIKLLLGNVREAGKEWHRYKINNILDQAFKAADDGNHKKAKALTIVATAMIKNNRTDQNDGEQIPWEDIVPQPFEPTSDPRDSGLTPIPNLRQRIEELYEKYVEDIDYNVVASKIDDEPDKEDILQ